MFGQQPGRLVPVLERYVPLLLVVLVPEQYDRLQLVLQQYDRLQLVLQQCVPLLPVLPALEQCVPLLC